MTILAAPEGTTAVSVGETGSAAAWGALRALHVVSAEEGLVGYVAGELFTGEHVLDITGPHRSEPHYRHLIRGEALPWSRGVADAYGLGPVVDAAAAEPVPPLLTPAQAAAMIPAVNRDQVTKMAMTVDGIEYNLTNGTLYCLYVSGRGRPARMLFEAQAQAEAARRRAHDRRATPAATTAWQDASARWMAVRSKLPPAISPSALGRDVSAARSISPLPLPELHSLNRRPMPRRWVEAMILAHGAGLLEYLGPDPDDALVYRAQLADVHGQVTNLAVPGEWVLPWLLGLADGRDAAGQGSGNADAIAYREWLG